MSVPQFPPPEFKYDKNQRIMNRLEVESTSTKSLPISFPTYYLDKSIDNFNIEPKQQVDYNPIPKRFSQFIIDQQNPYLSQRLDNLSSREEEPLRDISDSMGSQATIFSTRQDSSIVPTKRSKSKWLKKRNSKSSNVQLTRQSSITSSLKRTKAIKIKQGSKWYRLKLFFKKLRQKIFKVSNKRKVSMKRSKTLIRKQRSNPQNKHVKQQISNPITNPNLGQQPVFKIRKIGDLNPRDQQIYTQEDSNPKERHLSNYIQEQEKLQKKPSPPNEFVQLPSPNFDENLSEFESIAPSLPPHLDASFQKQISKPIHKDEQSVDLQKVDSAVAQENIHQLWHCYLRFVLFKRIQLRHEIEMFQNYLLETTTPVQINFDKESTIKSDNEVESTSSIYTSIETETDTIGSNNKEGDFKDRILKRESILADMLDYSSEDEEEEEEDDDDDDDVFSIQNSNSIRSKTYGTIKYTRGRSTNSSLKRTFGLAHSLSQLSLEK
ncbi:unnamed protein product [Candida verbasci]|uniref:Uncharacterized protein n=1 Tax=Candida verbasci TaxID=1227364 RepID=A0A9W4TWS4_9ASCO|nr:unnamed protein product [Candida verbasci]